MSYEFNANGTYSYTANFDIVISHQRITIHEKGTYSVQDDTLTLMPTSKRYMRNGVDEGDELKVRVFKFRLELNASQDQVNLILPGEASDDVFIKG